MIRHQFLALCFFLPLPLFAQTSDMLPAENLVVENIPPIPAGLADKARRYTEFRDATWQSWNPSRLEMLIRTRFADVPQIHLVGMPGGQRTQLTFFPDRVGGATFHPVKPDYFIFNKDIGGGEWYQNFRYDMATGDVTLLTDGKSRNTLGVFSTAGDRIVYSSTRRNGKDYDFYIMNPERPREERMLAQLDQGEGWAPLDWSPDDSRILAVQELSINESYLWSFNASDGQKNLLTPKQGSTQVSYRGGQFGKDGKGFYTTTDNDNEFLRLTYVDLATGKQTYLTSDIPWDVRSFELSYDGRTMAFTTNEQGLSKLYLLDIPSGRRHQVPGVPVGVLGSVNWHRDNRHLAFGVGSARSATDIYVLDAANDHIDRWTFSETGGLNTDDLPEPELIRWKTFDGKMITGFLYRPPARFGGKRPVIVDIHGGPESQAFPSFLGRTNFYLKELGIAVVRPNVRGSSGFGKTFLKLDNGFLREDSYKDIGSLLDWIRNESSLDGDRIMIQGGSYGGHMTLAVAARYSDRIRCAVDLVGMSNLVTFLEHTEAYRRDLRRVEYGDERDSKMRAFLEKIAPLNNAASIIKPLFVIQGKNDPRVPANEALQITRTLKETKTPVWFLMANDEGHGFAKKRNSDYQFLATILFAQTYLLK